MPQDRLHVLDVDMSVEDAARIGCRIQNNDNQCIAVCYQTGVIAIANGRFVDLYGVSDNSLHPFTFLRQISIRDHVTHLRSSVLGDTCDEDLCVAAATCVACPVPGFLLVGAIVEVPESRMSGTGSTVDPSRTILLLGFRLYAGSVSQYAGAVDGDKPRQAPASIQVYFSFVEPVVGAAVQSIRCLQSFWSDMTPDSGAVVVLFEDSAMFGVFSWKERFSDRLICLAQMKQQAERLVVSECSPDGRYIVVGDGGGQLSLIDFERFLKKEDNVPSKSQQMGGKRLKLGPCSRSGVIARDNPLEDVRLVYTLAMTTMNCVYTSIRWWICGVRGQQNQFVLAGKQDGSLSVFKLIQRNDGIRSTVELKLIQMYPGLASGTHDAVRSISEPLKFTGSNPVNGSWFEFCIISEMRWRIWQLKMVEDDDGLSKRHRILWPSVKDSLDYPAIMVGARSVKCTTILHNSTDFSNLVAKALSDTAPDHSARYPISLSVADGRLQVIGLLMTASIEAIETASNSENHESESNESGSEDKSGEREEAPEAAKSVSVEDAEPTTIQDMYKLPPMQWKARSSVAGARNLNEDRLTKEQDHDSIPANSTRMSKLNRTDYNDRVSSVIQRVETLSSVMKSMRTSFQLFSNDVQQHMNLISEQLEEISRRRHQRRKETMEKSYLQTQAEMAHFDAGARDSNNQTPSPVIPHAADKYDPDHPDADWGGYVRRSYKKRYFTDQSGVKDSLIYDEKGGIMPRAAENSTSGKKLFEPQQNPSGEQVPGIPFQSSVYQVGPGNNVSCSDWKTSYESQTLMEATPKDNFVLGTRQNSQHKRHVEPMYEQGRESRQNSARLQSPSSPWEGRQVSPSLNGSGSSGSLSGRRIDSRRSLLAGIGKLVTADDLSGIRPPPERHLSESYTNSASKTLLAENYHGTTLGYTGRRNMY